MTVASTLTKIKQQLQSVSQPRLEADRLVAHVLLISTSELFQHENKKIEPEKMTWLNDAIQRRLQGEPLAYILEEQGFFKSDFIVRKGVLIPRPETELAVETALRLFPKQPPSYFADLGCGSGCIGLSLLKEWSSSRLLAVDSSSVALQITKENAVRMGLESRCEILERRVEKLKQDSVFDLIVANPPYIAPDDPQLEENVRKYEPAEALFAERSGFAAIFSWSAWALDALKSGGWWIAEIGAGQSDAVSVKLNELGFTNLGIKKDLADFPRVVCAQKP